jgi:septal ring factor EnvC (AmiA/AmiB activator)
MIPMSQAVARLAQIRKDINRLEQDTLRLLEHPDATNEQIAEASVMLRDIRARVREVNSKLAKHRLEI